MLNLEQLEIMTCDVFDLECSGDYGHSGQHPPVPWGAVHGPCEWRARTCARPRALAPARCAGVRGAKTGIPIRKGRNAARVLGIGDGAGVGEELGARPFRRSINWGSGLLLVGFGFCLQRVLESIKFPLDANIGTKHFSRRLEALKYRAPRYLVLHQLPELPVFRV